MPLPTDDERDSTRLDSLRRHGDDAVSFQGLKSAMDWWQDAAPPKGTGASLAFVESGRSWIAVGSPLVEESLRSEAARRFADAARARRRRVVFFGVEKLEPFASWRRLTLGLQSVVLPARWQATLRASPRLREQVRRARAKNVVVRLVSAEELSDDSPLRAVVGQLGSQWLAARRMEPLAFLVEIEPFHARDEHLYLIAERHGVPVQFLSAVPIYTRGGWLVEDILRGPRAPNGTTELMLDRLMRELGDGPVWFTPGLTPLAGDVSWWLRFARVAMCPLYDFSGLLRFRARLSPARWDPVWLVWDRGPAALVLFDVLRAFAGGRLLPFAWHSLVWHPHGPPWAVAVPLVAWTVLLAALLAVGASGLLGFSPLALAGWILFDALLAWALFAVARRPRVGRLASVAACAAFDAIVSVRHLADVGLGDSAATALLRLIATAGPLVGTTALIWAIGRARARP